MLGIVLDADAPFDPSEPGRGILAEHRVPTPHDGVEALASALSDIVATLRAEAQSKLGGDLTAVGLGAPGLVDRDGVMHTGPNLPGITRFGFAERLTADTGLSAVVDNDATCAAWGEHERGASAGQNHSILVTLGTGLLISSVTKSQFIASQVAIVVTFLPAMMLSGFLFDLLSMPAAIRTITYILPARYYVALLQTIFLAGDIWGVIVPNAAVLAAMAAGLLLLSRVATQKKLA